MLWKGRVDRRRDKPGSYFAGGGRCKVDGLVAARWTAAL